MNRTAFRTDPATVLLFGTGGEGRERAEWRDGQRTGEVITRDGATVRRLSGVAVSVGGLGLDGAVVETTTPIDEVPAGAVFRASGVCEVSVRAEAQAGIGKDAPPRASLSITVFIERLEPVGSVADLVNGKAAPARRGGGE